MNVDKFAQNELLSIFSQRQTSTRQMPKLSFAKAFDNARMNDENGYSAANSSNTSANSFGKERSLANLQKTHHMRRVNVSRAN